MAIDLFCGLGGWTEGLIAEGYDVIGVDIEQHVYGEHRYPARLIIQDVRKLHGSQCKDAALIVASPPCQEYSYMAMPWTRAKAKAAAIRADHTGAELERLNALFNACFRIQREASEAAGKHIPLIIENVRGAQKWVGRARWNFGSFYLWGDVPALMPQVVGGLDWSKHGQPGYRGEAFNTHAERRVREGMKGVPHRTSGHWTNPAEHEGVKNGNDWFASGEDCSLQRRYGSKSKGRKMASAMIAKIPLPLSRHIAATFRPRAEAA